ncbi:uncharacterized protein LOC133183779 [Saccostrea echinata]|uniref:uncharacterized protein LOC133183779 n=1 Tax=Saccostrea echinata TaxID=191078 RepID=UPI002A81D56C|nr:uncharacterized protein LOC133183779 [Saccostrea echinata]
MSGIVRVSEAVQRENFFKTHPVVTWTFGADDELHVLSDRPNLTSSTYERLSTSRSQESEDSGVKSSVSTSHNEDEAPVSPASTTSDDTKRRRSILRKLSTSSGLSLRSNPSSPLFDFPTFEELFEGKGKFKLSTHHSKPIFSRQQSYPGPAVAVLDENTDDTEISLTATEEKPKSIKRLDSTMSQNFSSLVHDSWKGSKGFRGYRQRLGNALHHRYCMCCRFESTLFIGLYCLVGLFLSSSGIVCYINCLDEILVSCYLTVDGILSVFVFPILVMGWTRRVGGCVGDEEDVGTGTFWISVLVLRILLTASGTFVCIYRYCMEEPVWESKMCQFEFYALLGGIVFEWIFCVTAIFLPMCFYCVLYCFAPSYGAKSGLYTINVDEQK